MFIENTLVYLRALEPKDINVLYEWENDLKLWPVSFTQMPFSKFILEEFVNASHQDIYTNKQLRLMVNDKSSHETIGAIDLFEFDPQHARCGIGIYIHENFRQQGFASQCIELIKTYAFNTLNLKQIYAHVNENNQSSLKLFTNCGFEKNGLKKCWHKTGLNSFENVWFLQYINNGI